jgi:hypothetical protein
MRIVLLKRTRDLAELIEEKILEKFQSQGISVEHMDNATTFFSWLTSFSSSEEKPAMIISGLVLAGDDIQWDRHFPDAVLCVRMLRQHQILKGTPWIMFSTEPVRYSYGITGNLHVTVVPCDSKNAESKLIDAIESTIRDFPR